MSDAQETRAYARVATELKRIQVAPPAGITVFPLHDDLTELEALIEGQPGTPYEGGEFRLKITIPPDYPFQPPDCKFKTRIFHPNIDKTGLICLDSLKPQPKGQWSAIMTLEIVLIQIQSLLANPNFSDALDNDIARKYCQNRDGFEKEARRMTQEFAKSPRLDVGGVSVAVDPDESD